MPVAPNNLVPQTLLQIRNDVRLLLGDSPALAVAYSDSTINFAINYAIQHYLRITGKSYIQYTTTCSVNGVIALPNAYIEVDRIGVGSTNQWLLQSSLSDETNKNPNWENVTGAPKRWLIYDGTNIRTVPKPASTLTARIGYIEEPININLDADTVDPRVPITFQRFLKYAAAYWLLMIDGDGQDVQLALGMMQQFVELIKESK